MVDIKIRFKDK